TIAQMALGAHPHIVWQYGHADRPGSAHGYLSHPDDAYLLADGHIDAADIINCRVPTLDRAGQAAHRIGRAGDCLHNPPATTAPRSRCRCRTGSSLPPTTGTIASF